MIRSLSRSWFAVIGLWVFCLAGCGYALQGKSNLPVYTIAIGVIENSTFEPKLQDRLNKALTETLLEYSIEVDSRATQRIDGKISRFELRVLSEKNLVASQYDVLVTASFTLTDTGSGKTASLGEVSSPFAHYFSSVGAIETVLSQKEIATDQALKNLSQELARRIIYAPLR